MCLSLFIFCIYLLGLSWWIYSYFCINVFILYYAVCGMSVYSLCIVLNFGCVCQAALETDSPGMLGPFFLFLPPSPRARWGDGGGHDEDEGKQQQQATGNRQQQQQQH